MRACMCVWGNASGSVRKFLPPTAIFLHRLFVSAAAGAGAGAQTTHGRACKWQRLHENVAYAGMSLNYEEAMYFPSLSMAVTAK